LLVIRSMIPRPDDEAAMAGAAASSVMGGVGTLKLVELVEDSS
jgi:hypothetical protein